MPDEGTNADTVDSGDIVTKFEPDPDTPLGEKGEKALRAMTERARAAEKEAKRVSGLEAELEQLRQKSMTENEKAIEKAKADGRAEALSAVNERVIRSEIRAAAAGKLADPADAVAYLRDELDSFLDKKGDVDEKAIAAAVDALIEAKPYLASSVTNVGSADGGGRGATQGHGDMNAALRRAAGR